MRRHDTINTEICVQTSRVYRPPAPVRLDSHCRRAGQQSNTIYSLFLLHQMQCCVTVTVPCCEECSGSSQILKAVCFSNFKIESQQTSLLWIRIRSDPKLLISDPDPTSATFLVTKMAGNLLSTVGRYLPNPLVTVNFTVLLHSTRTKNFRYW